MRRSSLECEGALRCQGLGPTTPGKCAAPGAGEETSCGGTVDSLATYTRQDDVDKQHPGCKHRCIKHKCQAPVGDGAACLISSDCQDGLQCLLVPGAPETGNPPKKCVAGRTPARPVSPARAATAKALFSASAAPARRANLAARPAATTSSAGVDCVRKAGTKGVCGPRCDIRGSAATRRIRDGFAARDAREHRRVSGARAARGRHRGRNERRGLGRRRRNGRWSEHGLADENGGSAEPNPECPPRCPDHCVHRDSAAPAGATLILL